MPKDTVDGDVAFAELDGEHADDRADSAALVAYAP
jgi:hypothetical protein